MTNQSHVPGSAGTAWPQRPVGQDRAPAAPGQPARTGGHAVHSAHKWMMLLMCLPLVGVGVWVFVRGGDSSALLSGLLCMGMMLMMHKVMGGHGRGADHSRH